MSKAASDEDGSGSDADAGDKKTVKSVGATPEDIKNASQETRPYVHSAATPVAEFDPADGLLYDNGTDATDRAIHNILLAARTPPGTYSAGFDRGAYKPRAPSYALMTAAEQKGVRAEYRKDRLAVRLPSVPSDGAIDAKGWVRPHASMDVWVKNSNGSGGGGGGGGSGGSAGSDSAAGSGSGSAMRDVKESPNTLSLGSDVDGRAVHDALVADVRKLADSTKDYFCRSYQVCTFIVPRVSHRRG